MYSVRKILRAKQQKRKGLPFRNFVMNQTISSCCRIAESFGLRCMKEIRITLLLMKSNILGAMVVGVIFSLSIFYSTTLVDSIRWSIGKRWLVNSVVIFFLYQYTFELANQAFGVEEDRINKPNRPIPVGLVTANQLKRRLLVSSVLYLFLSWMTNIFWYSCLWQLMTWFYPYLSSHWFSKNIIFISVGTFVMLASAWIMVLPINDNAWWWMLKAGVAAGFGCVIQDNRDVEGDRTVGRHTAPVLYGVIYARFISAICLAVLAIIFWFDLCTTLLQQLVSTVVVLPTMCAAIVLSVYETVCGPSKKRRTLDSCLYYGYVIWFVQFASCGAFFFPELM